ncbi:hypothetical protein [Vibrio mediterranei]|uniref:hypothetical protein n=1 Tax=Vibrio mediterranei TaxID=689 RepID=UPI00148CA690|nr:hypothetical protein [Vibrio mediterranei]NOH29503.1 hypothetical protein [Vibrio mediterranei]
MRLLPIKDESLHGYLFRAYKVTGLTKRCPIITTLGAFKASQFYLDLNYLDLIALQGEQWKAFCQQSGFHHYLCASSYEREYDNPSDFQLSYFKAECRMGLRKSIVIRYCSKCIDESLFHHGFGYLKAGWLWDNDCQVHKSKLDKLLPISHTNTLKELGLILRGKKPEQLGYPSGSSHAQTPEEIIKECSAIRGRDYIF